MTSLIERLEAATGADRELDALIMINLGLIDGEMFGLADGYVWELRLGWGTNGEAVVEAWATCGDGLDQLHMTRKPRPLTASLDAALALVEEKLPGWKRGLAEQDAGGWCASLWKPQPGGKPSVLVFAEDAPTPALAVLIALLKALEGK